MRGVAVIRAIVSLAITLAGAEMEVVDFEHLQWELVRSKGYAVVSNWWIGARPGAAPGRVVLLAELTSGRRSSWRAAICDLDEYEMTISACWVPSLSSPWVVRRMFAPESEECIIGHLSALEAFDCASKALHFLRQKMSAEMERARRILAILQPDEKSFDSLESIA